MSRSKGAAVADLLREVGRRQDLSGGEDYVSAMAALSGVGSPDISKGGASSTRNWASASG